MPRRMIFSYPETVAETEKTTAKKLIENLKRIVAVEDYGRGEIQSIGWDQASDQRGK